MARGEEGNPLSISLAREVEKSIRAVEIHRSSSTDDAVTIGANRGVSLSLSLSRGCKKVCLMKTNMANDGDRLVTGSEFELCERVTFE